jgi:hypothetical protein
MKEVTEVPSRNSRPIMSIEDGQDVEEKKRKGKKKK